MKARRGDGDGRGLVLGGIWPVWGDRCSLCGGERWEHARPVASAIATLPRDEQTDVRRGWTGMPGLSELIQPFSNDALSSPPIIHLITPYFHDSSTVAHTLISWLRLPFSSLWIQILVSLLFLQMAPLPALLKVANPKRHISPWWITYLHVPFVTALLLLSHLKEVLLKWQRTSDRPRLFPGFPPFTWPHGGARQFSQREFVFHRSVCNVSNTNFELGFIKYNHVWTTVATLDNINIQRLVPFLLPEPAIDLIKGSSQVGTLVVAALWWSGVLMKHTKII